MIVRPVPGTAPVKDTLQPSGRYCRHDTALQRNPCLQSCVRSDMYSSGFSFVSRSLQSCSTLVLHPRPSQDVGFFVASIPCLFGAPIGLQPSPSQHNQTQRVREKKRRAIEFGERRAPDEPTTAARSLVAPLFAACGWSDPPKWSSRLRARYRRLVTGSRSPLHSVG